MRRTSELADSHKELGLFTQADEFQTFNTPENLSNRGPLASKDVKIAPLAKRQVNDAGFDGTLRLDGRLFRTEMFEKNIMASACGNNWGQDEWDDLVAFMTQETEKVEQGEGYPEVDLAELKRSETAIMKP